ncbi:MAG: penicillin-binding protein 1A [Alphaproteobacteria bacterium]|nr:MAG: penicillin-binding protein 1A [Alphaproteobacteria bacterium]
MNIVLGILAATIIGGIVALVGLVLVLHHFGRSLPDYTQLADYQPPVVTRIHAGDGSLIEEYARQKRLFVPIGAIPKPVIQAFLSAEDKNFYDHGGLDYVGITRAVLTNLRNVVTGRRLVGASTITQQVAKNFLLSSEVSFTRKIKEAILAYRIERAFTKDEILELYLNEIYLGYGSYGVAAAALNYFNKALDELTLAEAAYLAALPKAPNNYHPVRRHAAAVARRNWVLGRMGEDGYLTDDEVREAQAQPLETRPRTRTKIFRADYFTEEVRRELYRVYGEQGLYEAGLSVRTTLDPRLQAITERALRSGLIEYDRRHGWRGPITRFSAEVMADPERWAEKLSSLDIPLGMDGWQLAVVLDVSEQLARIGLANGSTGEIGLDGVKWARRWLPEQKVGGPVQSVDEVLDPGDVVAVEELATDGGGRPFALRQVPDVGGAVVAMDPHTGRVLAMVGGFSYDISEYNRATQAMRQPGSAFKPFVYAAALDAGFTPSSLVLDAPFVIDQGMGQGKWKPSNYSDKFYGPSTLRLGLEQSRNLMTVRLAQYIGMDRIVDYAERFHIQDNMPPTLAHALGSGETTLLRLTAAYGMLVNGGKEIEPTLIDRIQDRRGRTIYRHDRRPCKDCVVDFWDHQPQPEIPDTRQQVVDPAIAYQVVSMLEGVVQRGTGRRIREIGKPLAGKTGTTNDSNDAWFIGFSPDLVVGVYVGFDQPRTLGAREQGATAAAPIFKTIMEQALAGKPGTPFRIPPGVNLVRVDARTGLPSDTGNGKTILEAFIPGTEPTAETQAVLDGPDSLADTGTKLKVGTGGLY